MIGLSETRFDLRFHLFGVPVRVHPVFWLVSAIMGWHENNLPLVVLWIACVFVSILVHEFGHALMSKRFDSSPSVVLWGMGGLCYSQGDRQTPMQRLAVVLAGPGAGFLLLAVVMSVTTVLFQVTPLEHGQVLGRLFRLNSFPEGVWSKLERGMNHNGEAGFTLNAYFFLVQINFLWGLVNLLPVWPLDGGQATQILLSLYDRQRSQRLGHIISLLVAGAVAVMLYSLTQDMFLTIFFGYFALVNYQVLQTLHQAQSMGLYQEDEWWRR